MTIVAAETLRDGLTVWFDDAAEGRPAILIGDSVAVFSAVQARELAEAIRRAARHFGEA